MIKFFSEIIEKRKQALCYLNDRLCHYPRPAENLIFLGECATVLLNEMQIESNIKPDLVQKVDDFLQMFDLELNSFLHYCTCDDTRQEISANIPLFKGETELLNRILLPNEEHIEVIYYI